MVDERSKKTEMGNVKVNATDEIGGETTEEKYDIDIRLVSPATDSNNESVNFLELSDGLQRSLNRLKGIQYNYLNAITPILKQQEYIAAFVEPMRRIQEQFISSYSIFENYHNVTAISINNLISSYQYDLFQKIQAPICQILQAVDFSPLYGIFESLKGFDLSKYRDSLNKIVIEETYDAKWFPHAFCTDDSEMIIQFWEILETTRKSKNRVKKIDCLIFEKYDKQHIETMKKDWRQKDIPEYKMRMMHQAVQAYHRKEYALTVVMLSTLWEGIIYDKANDLNAKNGKRTKEDFNKLIENAEYDELFYSFFNEYIMYDCRSENDVKEDVPGRNSSAHSWYNKYPSRKAGLNAILFTDFLINLEPIKGGKQTWIK
jgi:hypothetical protein